MASIIWVIEGYVSAFTSYEDALKFVKWYNVEYFDEDYIDPSQIKRRFLQTSEDMKKYERGVE